MHKLIRLSDGQTKFGSEINAVKWKEDKSFDELIKCNKPIIGCSFLLRRTINEYWLTTPVSEIIEEQENYIKFKTQNSTYEFFY